MLASSNPRSRKRFSAAERMRLRVSPALGVPRSGLIGGFRVGSIAPRRVNVAEFGFELPIVQQSQPFRGAMPVGRENRESRPREAMRPMPITLERVQAHEPY